MTFSLLTIYGTRPEAIKLAPIIKALETESDFVSNVVSAGQHVEMLDQVHTVFGLRPEVDLAVMEPGQSLNRLAGKVLGNFDRLIDRFQPDAILVQGDTATVAAGALAGYYAGTSVIHVEAGLRSGDLQSPFPEEGNRRLVSQIASLHLAPTDIARQNLAAEGISPEAITVTGNTVIDALQIALASEPRFSDPRMRTIFMSDDPIVLITIHRRENWGLLAGIALAIRTLAELLPDHTFVLPLHGNPLVRDTFRDALGSISNVALGPPLGYGEFVHAMARSSFVITDSGGVQEEAPSLGKPVFVARDNTERPEAITAGTVRLVGTSTTSIVEGVLHVASDAYAFQRMARAANPYGDGHASERSIAAIKHLFGLAPRPADFSGGNS